MSEESQNIVPIWHDQFTDALEALRLHALTQSRALRGIAQPEWLDLSDKVDTRDSLLEKLNRIEINDHYMNAMKKAANVEERTTLADEIQHDFVAGLARDWLHWRRSRLSRLFARIATDEGYGDPERSPFVVTLRQFVQNIIETTSV